MNWIGNVYHKFETVCQKVDYQSNQDKVKYVEDHVQTVVKKFCTDVLQDLIPPVKSEAQDMASKDTNADSCCELVDKEEDYGSPAAADKVSVADPSNIYTKIKQLRKNALDEIHLVNQFNDNLQGSHKGIVTDILPEKLDLFSSNMNSGNTFGADSFDEKPAKSELLESNVTAKKDSFKSSSGLIDHNQVCVTSLSTSVHGVDLAPQNVGTISYNSSDDQSSASNASSVSDSPEMASSVSSEDEKVTEFQSSQNVGKVCINSISECLSMTNTPSTSAKTELSYSLLPSEKKIFKTSSPTSCSSIFTEKQSQSANPFSNITTGVVPCATSSSVASTAFEGCTVRLSSTSSPTGSSIIKKKGVSSSSAVLSLGLIGTSPKSSCVVGDMLDSQMETIDLSDKGKLEDSCFLVNDSLLYEVSRRIQKSRSYKKKIQDAFTSKKRLAKEYELIAIWYDDLDRAAPGEDGLLRRLSSGTTVTVESDCQSGDGGWELL